MYEFEELKKKQELQIFKYVQLQSNKMKKLN